MSSPIILQLIGVVPIPVGHEVEIRVFLVDTAVFGSKLEPQLDSPLVIDIDTGIQYGEQWIFKDSGDSNIGSLRANPLPLGPRSDLKEHGRWRGRVTAARVAWIEGGSDRGFSQTALAITPHDPDRPYR